MENKRNKRHSKLLNTVLVSSMMLGALPVGQIHATAGTDTGDVGGVETVVAEDSIKADIQELGVSVTNLVRIYSDTRYDAIMKSIETINLEIDLLEDASLQEAYRSNLELIEYVVENLVNDYELSFSEVVDRENDEIRDLLVQYVDSPSNLAMREITDRMNGLSLIISGIEDGVVREKYEKIMVDLAQVAIQTAYDSMEAGMNPNVFEFRGLLDDTLYILSKYDASLYEGIMTSFKELVASLPEDHVHKDQYLYELESTEHYMDQVIPKLQELLIEHIDTTNTVLEEALANTNTMTSGKIDALNAYLSGIQLDVLKILDVPTQETYQDKVDAYQLQIDDIVQSEIDKGIKIGVEDLNLEVGKDMKLKQSSPLKVIWSSSDDTIATVDAYGRVKSVGVGDVVITVAIDGSDISDTIAISVVEAKGDVTPPVEEEETPENEEVPPAEEETPENEEVPPVEEETPENEEVPPTEEETPENEEVPPVEEETPPVEEGTPENEETPPAEEGTPEDEFTPGVELSYYERYNLLTFGMSKDEVFEIMGDDAEFDIDFGSIMENATTYGWRSGDDYVSVAFMGDSLYAKAYDGPNGDTVDVVEDTTPEDGGETPTDTPVTNDGEPDAPSDSPDSNDGSGWDSNDPVDNENPDQDPDSIDGEEILEDEVMAANAENMEEEVDSPDAEFEQTGSAGLGAGFFGILGAIGTAGTAIFRRKRK